MTRDHNELLAFLYRSPIALVRAKLDGTVETMTPLACQWLLPLAESANLENLFSILKNVAPDLRSLVEKRSSSVICDGRLLHLDASTPRERHLSLIVHLFSDDSIAAILTDVSNEHRQIDHAKKGLNTLRNTLQTSPIAVGIARLSDQKVVFFNKAYAELVNPPTAEAPVPDMRKIYKDQDWFEHMKRRLATEEFILNQLIELTPLSTSPARRAWALASYMVIDYESERSILTWLYDVTELQQARQVSEEAYLAKARFLATMSHEIRTPMNAIFGMLKILEGTEITARQYDYISKASGAAQNLLNLLDDVLDFSKADAGKIELECQPFQFEDLLRDLSVVLTPDKVKNIEVLFDVDPQLPDTVSGDVHRLRQILINLGGNAIKFTESGQVVVALKLARWEPTFAKVTFLIEDSGIGITPEQQQRIFTGFSQADTSTTRRFGGSGLGLAISKSLVELMGGTLRLDSSQDQGSTFSFDIDFSLDSGARKVLSHPDSPQVKKQRVLIVDDNPIARELISAMVKSFGWACECAQHGDKAIEILTDKLAEKPDEVPFTLFLVNWQMPQTDGWTTSRRIKDLLTQVARDAPSIILLSDNGRHDLSQRTPEEQAVVKGFLAKPFTSAMLLKAVADIHAEKPSVRKLSLGRSVKNQLEGMRILVVEDNLVNQLVAEQLLKSAGAVVSVAANGALAVEAVKQAEPQFDVVLMDLQMPVMDGFAATSAIRNELKLSHLPIVAMTANAMASDRESCLASGMNEHVGKPFDLAKLISLLIRMTGIKPASTTTGELAQRTH